MEKQRGPPFDQWLAMPGAQSPEERKAQIVTLLVLGCMAAGLLLLVVNVLQWISVPSSTTAAYVAMDVAGLLALAGLWRVNRAGHTRWAGLAFLFVLSVLLPVMFPLRVLDRALIVCAIPVMAASVILRPAASFLLAAVSSSVYTLVYFRDGRSVSYNLISVPILFLLALMAWVATDRQEKYEAGRRQAAEDLRRSAEEWEATFDVTSDMLSVNDSDFRLVHVNHAFASAFGAAPEDLAGKTCYELVHGCASAPDFCPHRRTLASGKPESAEFYEPHLGKWLEVTTSPILDEGGQAVASVHLAHDITGRKLAQQREQLAREVLELLNRPQGQTDTVRDILRLIKTHMDLEAVGIRLRAGDDFPYYATDGFSQDFVRAECSLCGRDEAGQLVRDGSGNPLLECMCGNIIRGRTDAALPFFTEAGSFWSNSTTQLLATTTEKERQGHTRNCCNAAGYESVALIPLRSDREIIGLLQLNDHRPDRFTPAIIRFLEGLGASIAIALSRKQAGEALRASEEKYQRLVEDASVGICSADVYGELTFVNQALCRELGYSTGEMLGRPFIEFVHADDQQRIVESFFAGLTDPKGRLELDFRAVRKDGSALDFYTSVTHLKQGESTTGFLAVMTNVTARRWAEEALRESETRFRGLFEHSPVSLWEEDFSQVKLRIDQLRASGTTDLRAYYREHPEEAARCAALARVVDVNQATLRLYGASSKGELLAGIGKVFGEESYLDFARALTAVAEGKTDYESEVANWTLAGEKKQVILKWMLFPGYEDTWAKVLVSITDITERKQAEKALRESEERFRQLVEHAPEAVVVHAGGLFLYLNPAAVKLYGGQSALQLLGTPVMDRIDPSCHDLVIERLRTLEAQKVALPLVEETFLHIDGSPFPVEVATVPIQWDGQSGALVFVRDLTELKRSEHERLEMERRLLHAQKLESLGVLAGGIAHDFNNLLLALLGNLELALEDMSPIAPVRVRVEQAVAAAKRAADLTRQMLAYSGKGRFDIMAVDLSELVEENAHMLRSAVARNVTFSLQLSRDLPPIEADAGQIQQVVMNLITNASEAMGDKPGIVALFTGVQECDEACLNRSLLEEKPAPGRFVWLEVRDTGCGMDQRTLQRVFEPFFTTKYTGRGLGMAAVHGIVRGHQGAIWIDSVVGQGTTVRVLFPAAEHLTALPLHRAATDAESARAAQAALLSGTVLVVDDEQMVCDMVAAALTGMGLEVLTAADGREAVALFRQHSEHIVCVLLDLTMPNIDGVTTLGLLREIQPDVRVILSSGYDEQEATRRFAGQGLAGFLHKPYHLKALRAKVQKVLQEP